MGHKDLYSIYAKRNELYEKDDLTDEESMRIGEFEELFGEMDGYSSESDASNLLNDLGIVEDLHQSIMHIISQSLRFQNFKNKDYLKINF